MNNTGSTGGAALVAVLTPPCMGCNDRSSILLPAGKVEAWRNGALIQRVFPNMSAADRETLISGTHPACWDAMFAGDES